MLYKVKYKNVFFHYKALNSRKSCILLLHGLGGTSYSFKRYFKILEEKNISFFASDHPFHGYTEERDFQTYVDTIFELIEKKGYKEIKIVSHSFGSYVTELFYTKFKGSVKNIMLITPFIEAKKQTKGLGLFLYEKKEFFRYAGKILSIFPEKFKYPDYAKIGRKPYYAYWLNDMTHTERKGYFEIQYFVADRKIENSEFLNVSEIHLGIYDIITYCDLTQRLLKNYNVKNIFLHKGDHLFPLKEFKNFKENFIQFVDK